MNFWATWCGPCTAEFPELQKTWRMYRRRPFQVVTVSINYPDEEKGGRSSWTRSMRLRETCFSVSWTRTKR